MCSDRFSFISNRYSFNFPGIGTLVCVFCIYGRVFFLPMLQFRSRNVLFLTVFAVFHVNFGCSFCKKKLNNYRNFFSQFPSQNFFCAFEVFAEKKENFRKKSLISFFIRKLFNRFIVNNGSRS